ncbi:MAG: S26 family signal peptidase [archaeon]
MIAVAMTVSLLLAIPFRNPFAIKNNEIICDNEERINTSQIQMEPDRIIINIDNTSISKYGNTSSMIPLINENSKGITVEPKSANDIKMGDIITYEFNGELIVHRVINIGEDANGWYCIVKGDNTQVSDGKIRFEQIKSILIGILY